MVVVAALPQAAVARTAVGADVSISAAVASNPFSSSTTSTGSVSAAVGISPWITFTEAASSLRLSGEVRVTEYDRFFGRTESFRVGAEGNWQLSPQLTLQTSISYSEAIVGETNLVDGFATAPGVINSPAAGGGGTGSGVINNPTVVGGPIVIIDPTLIGLGTRRNSFSTSASMQYRPDSRQQFGLSLYATDSKFSNALSGNNYAIFGETITYDRVFKRGTIGASLNLQRYECRSQQSCSQVVTSPQLTVSLRLNNVLSLSGAAGVSISSLRLPTLQSKTVTPSISGSICRRDNRSSACFTASHTVEATALNGARPIVSMGLSTSYRLTERNRISLSGNYSASTQAGVAGDTFRYVSARLNDEHRIGRRTYVGVTGSYTNSRSSFIGQRTNIEVSLGVRFSFGRGA